MAKCQLVVKFTEVKKRIKQGETNPRYKLKKKSSIKCGAVHTCTPSTKEAKESRS